MWRFHKVYINLLNLEDSCDSYQSDKAVMKQVMVAVCKATRIAITYFI